MHFGGCVRAHLGHKLGTFDYLHQGSHKLHFKNHSGTLYGNTANLGHVGPSFVYWFPKNVQYEPICCLKGPLVVPIWPLDWASHYFEIFWGQFGEKTWIKKVKTDFKIDF